MSFIKTAVVNTGINNFENQDQYFAFIDSFETVLKDFHEMKKTYVNLGKIISTERTYRQNQIEFTITFDSEESCNLYEQEPLREILIKFYQDLEWQIIENN